MTKEQNLNPEDTSSFNAHNAEYERLYTVESIEQLYLHYDQNKSFENEGYAKALTLFSHRNLHVDIGTGSGWLLRKTAPSFTIDIGVEPSQAIVKIARQTLSEFKNISFINKGMIEAFIDIPLDRPVFFTSSTVFSHIDDDTVINFLTLLANAPKGSTLYFGENYDTAINHKLWHIRNKGWWSKNLPDWEIKFFDILNDGYMHGIFGTYVGRDNVQNHHTMNVTQRIQWRLHGLVNLAIKASNKLLKTKFQLIRF